MHADVMKLVDVLDSKSCVVYATCRFDSGHRHHFKKTPLGVFFCILILNYSNNLQKIDFNGFDQYTVHFIALPLATL